MKRGSAGIPALAVLLPGAAVGAGEARGHEAFKSAVYVSGKGGCHACRIPGLVVTTEGTLLAFCEGRKTSRSDLAVLPDGTVCCLCETGRKHPYQTIAFARFALSWVEAGTPGGKGNQ